MGTRTTALAALVLFACGTPEEDVSSTHVSRGSPDVDRWLDLTVTGTGFGVVEGMAVVLQVGRPDRRSQRIGWAETTVVTRFYILGILCAMLALATLKLR